MTDLFLSNLIVPVVTIICGRMMWKHYPKKINHICGYRTKRSMKNMDTWKFANQKGGQLWWKMGWIMLFLTIIFQLFFIKSSERVFYNVSLSICIIQVVALVISILPIEHLLKKKNNR